MKNLKAMVIAVSVSTLLALTPETIQAGSVSVLEHGGPDGSNGFETALPEVRLGVFQSEPRPSSGVTLPLQAATLAAAPVEEEGSTVESVLVAEPASMSLFGLGISGLLVLRRFRRYFH